jgi:predicted enzyme related to lactoylglutathione lyase
MAEFTRHEPGSFSWVELGTRDAAAAKAFYTSLFGWAFVDTPAGPNRIYTRLQLQGKDVGALYEQDEEQQAHGMPPNWMSYVTVASADQAAAKVKELGGKLMAEPFDVSTYGRMAIFQDPTGAMLAVWEPRQHIGVQIRDEPASLCWNELATRDPGAAAKFYTALFGWRTKGDPAGPYTEWYRGNVAIGGMMPMDPAWGQVPPHWTPYFQVGDCDGSARSAESLGARLLVPPQDIPNVGRFSMIQDPQGATFAIVTVP